MRHVSAAARSLALLSSSVVILLAFLFVVRPWYQQWGATDEETRRVLPGDEIAPIAVAQETRAITIGASVDRVWPWLAQLGQDRGGFYSYDLLENVVGSRMPTEDRLRPDLQAWRVGDTLWMYPRDRGGGVGYAVLRAFVPGRALAFGTHAPDAEASREDGSWTFVLEPIGDSVTRLLVRGRLAPGWSPPARVFNALVFEPMHFVMERRTMIGIKQLAEGSDRGRVLNHIHVALWTMTVALLVAALVMVVRRERWVRPLLGFIGAAAVFQVLTFLQPPLAVGMVLVLALVGLLWWPWPHGRATRRHGVETSPIPHVG